VEKSLIARAPMDLYQNQVIFLMLNRRIIYKMIGVTEIVPSIALAERWLNFRVLMIHRASQAANNLSLTVSKIKLKF
jgi:hypothetical protein